MAKCKACGNNTKLIKAHIIPESFFRNASGEHHGQLRMYHTDKGVFPKKAPIGVYDMKLVCRTCEDRFTQLDDYACKVLMKREPKEEKIIIDGTLVGHKLYDIDIPTLKMFFISLLWRASASQMPFYKKIKLGALEDVAKRILWGKGTANDDDFTFVLARFSGDTSKSIIDPLMEKWSGVTYCRFYLSEYVLYIKVDKQDTPDEWRRFIPIDNTLVIVDRGDMLYAKEAQILRKGIHQANELKKHTSHLSSTPKRGTEPS